MAPPGFSPTQLLTTPKTTSHLFTSPPPAPSQPSKQTFPLAINLEPVEHIFFTPPTSPHLFFDSLKDLIPQTTNQPPSQPSFDSIERLPTQPPSVPEVMKPPLPPLPPQLLPHSHTMWLNDSFPPLTHEIFYGHCHRTQVIINDLCDEMRSWQLQLLAISSDSSDESVGSPPSQVILFGDIPTVILSTSVVAPETSTIAPVISSAAHVVEMTLSLHPLDCVVWFPIWVSILALDGPPSQDPYVMTVARWRSKVSSPPSSSYVFPIAPVTVPPEIRRRPVILIRLGEAIPFAHRLTWRHASPRSLDHHPSYSSSSLDSSPVHSSGLDAPDQAHSGSSTRDVSPRLSYPSRRAPRRSEAFRRWCAAPLSTLYPPTTSESSSGDSSERPLHSSSHSAGPSRKRCRSPVDFVPSSTPVMGSLAPTRADILPPHKRFRYSYSSEASIEEDTKSDPIETEVDMELGIGDGDDVRDHVEIDPRDVRDDTEEYEADTSAGDMVEVSIDPMSALIVDEEIVEPAREDSSYRLPLYMCRKATAQEVETSVRAMLDIERDRVNSLRLYMSLSRDSSVCRDAMILGGDIGSWSHMLKNNIWFFALRLFVP
ncbi:hypothetical protein Tco_0840555 [Tanacetum coccineum]|uniref:Uncharacterized protein n=1 Tax=Tanacetum coccineum TaxID=301880 RepID=A0ABQ5AXT4_9ASTR